MLICTIADVGIGCCALPCFSVLLQDQFYLIAWFWFYHLTTTLYKFSKFPRNPLLLSLYDKLPGLVNGSHGSTYQFYVHNLSSGFLHPPLKSYFGFYCKFLFFIFYVLLLRAGSHMTAFTLLSLILSGTLDKFSFSDHIWSTAKSCQSQLFWLWNLYKCWSLSMYCM